MIQTDDVLRDELRLKSDETRVQMVVRDQMVRKHHSRWRRTGEPSRMQSKNDPWI